MKKVKVVHTIHDTADMEKLKVNGKIVASGNSWDECFKPRELAREVLRAVGIEAEITGRLTNKKWWS